MITPFRAWLNARLKEMAMPGIVLDLGSGAGSYAGNSLSVVRVDGNPATSPDVCTDLESRLPFPDNFADTVLLINVLEHVYFYEVLLNECWRVLKDGGSLILAAPFLMPEHKAKIDGYEIHDYQRQTIDSIWRQLKRAGFSKFLAQSYCPGPFTAAVNIVSYELHWQWLIDALTRLAWSIDSVWRKHKRPGPSAISYCLGYVITAKR